MKRHPGRFFGAGFLLQVPILLIAFCVTAHILGNPTHPLSGAATSEVHHERPHKAVMEAAAAAAASDANAATAQSNAQNIAPSNLKKKI